MDEAANFVGYELVDSNDMYRLYHMDVSGNWGTITQYEAIAIGTQAASLARSFPILEEANKTNLNEYTFEELSKYRMIYLAGFTYDDRADAEQLILSLSENGVHIVIAADGIPEDRATHNQSFLGVICNKMSFSNGYPELDTIMGVLNTDLFQQGHTQWEAVYVEGLDKCLGKIYDNEIELPFYGTVKNDNIVIMGLNLARHYELTHDVTVEKLFEYVMEVSVDEIPRREIVPLKLQQSLQGMQITSPKSFVNTSLAMHQDIFESEQNLYESNHFMYVDEGTTTITYQYPYFGVGCLVSIGSLLWAIAYIITRKRI